MACPAYADLYGLTVESLAALERMGEKSATNLVQAIAASKTRDVDRLVFALGVRHVGARAAQLLVERFGSVVALQQATAEALVEVEGVGSVVAQSLIRFFEVPANCREIERLARCGVRMEQSRRAAAAGPLRGMTVVVTGSLERWSRAEVEALIRRSGGRVSGSVSKQTSLVVAGAEPGSKLERAQALGVRTVDEREFRRMIKSA
jgi:DNA ligase (NAD+)